MVLQAHSHLPLVPDPQSTHSPRQHDACLHCTLFLSHHPPSPLPSLSHCQDQKDISKPPPHLKHPFCNAIALLGTMQGGMHKLHLKEARRAPTKACGDLDEEERPGATNPAQETAKSHKKPPQEITRTAHCPPTITTTGPGHSCLHAHTTGHGDLPQYIQHTSLGLLHPNTSSANKKIHPPNTTAQHSPNQPAQDSPGRKLPMHHQHQLLLRPQTTTPKISVLGALPFPGKPEQDNTKVQQIWPSPTGTKGLLFMLSHTASTTI